MAVAPDRVTHLARVHFAANWPKIRAVALQERLWRMDDQVAHAARVGVMLAHAADLQDRVAAMAVRDPCCGNLTHLVAPPSKCGSSQDGLLGSGSSSGVLPVLDGKIATGCRKLSRARSLPSLIESALALPRRTSERPCTSICALICQARELALRGEWIAAHVKKCT